MKETPIHQYLKDITNEDETIYELFKDYEAYRLKIEEKEYNQYAPAEDRAENWRELAQHLVYGLFDLEEAEENEDVMQDFCTFLDIPYGLKWFMPR